MGHSRQGSRGFTLLEVLVVLVILFTMALVGFPMIQQLIIRNKLLGVTRDLSIQLQAARQEAVKTGVPVVAQADYDADRLFIFANVDEDPNLTYAPDTSKTARTVDYEVGQVQLPKAQNPEADVHFWGPADSDPENADAVTGFSTASSGPNIAVFEPDGSVRDVGAFRIADGRGNFFEVRVSPAATARVEVRKYYKETPPWGGAKDFYPQGKHPSGYPLWRWWY